MQTDTVVLCLGANLAGRWGPPEATLSRATAEIEALGLPIVRASPRRETKPLGATRQPNYHNLLLRVPRKVPPLMLLMALQRIERAAGRRLARRWSARCLDIDLICFGGMVTTPRPGRKTCLSISSARSTKKINNTNKSNNYGPKTVRGRIQIPHPDLQHRTFVLEPMLDVAPHWRHPSIDAGMRTLLLGLRAPRRARRR